MLTHTRGRIGVSLIGAVMVVATVACSSGSPPAPTPITPTPLGLSISENGSFNAVGQTSQFAAVTQMSDGTTQNVSSGAAWQSSNAAVATVSASGLVTSRASGSGEIAATYQGMRAAVPVTVTVPAPPCTFSLAPSTQRFRPDVGSGVVGVSASASSCTWTATSTASWLRITGGASGTGSGTVGIRADAHSGRDDRVAHVEVAGQRAEVRQDGVGEDLTTPRRVSLCVDGTDVTHTATLNGLPIPWANFLDLVPGTYEVVGSLRASNLADGSWAVSLSCQRLGYPPPRPENAAERWSVQVIEGPEVQVGECVAGFALPRGTQANYRVRFRVTASTDPSATCPP